MTRRLDYVSLALAAGAAAVTIWVLFLPETLPDAFQTTLDIVEDDISPTIIAVILAVILFLVAAWRGIVSPPQDINRSLITDTAPEIVQETATPSTGILMERLYGNAVSEFNETSKPERRIAMYGRRAEETVLLPESVSDLFDELEMTACETYAIANNCSTDDAMTVVRDGTWTDDRVAAAFIATGETTVNFTAKERLIAWLSPKSVFEKRVERTVSAIEQTGDVFLTYSAPRDGLDVAISSAEIVEGEQ